MTRFRLVSLLLLSFAFLPQAKAQVGLYGGFTASKLGASNSNWFYGPTLGAYYDPVHLPVLSFGFDARVAILRSGSQPSTKVESGMIGPRVSLHLPVIPLRPYGEVLVGAAHIQAGQGAASSSSTHGGVGAAAGIDLTFFPRLDWRVVEYSYSHFTGPSGDNNQQTLTTGLVFRLPIP